MKPRNESAPTIDTPPDAARILILDDEPGILEVLEGILSEAGYRTEAAASGPEALGRARRDPPDLIVLDVAMPEMDGLELYQKVEQRHAALARRFTFVTGDEMAGATREALERIGAPALMKPFLPAEVRRVVQQVLRQAERG